MQAQSSLGTTTTRWAVWRARSYSAAVDQQSAGGGCCDQCTSTHLSLCLSLSVTPPTHPSFSVPPPTHTPPSHSLYPCALLLSGHSVRVESRTSPMSGRPATIQSLSYSLLGAVTFQSVLRFFLTFFSTPLCCTSYKVNERGEHQCRLKLLCYISSCNFGIITVCSLCLCLFVCQTDLFTLE